MQPEAQSVDVKDVDWGEVDSEELLEELKKEDEFDEFEQEFRKNAKDQKIRNTYYDKVDSEEIFEEPPSRFSKIKTFGSFLVNCFVRTKTVVTHVAVEDVDLSYGELTVTVRGSDTRLYPDRNDDGTFTDEFTFDMNDEDEKKLLQTQLDRAGVSSPDNLYGKRLPVKTHVPSNYEPYEASWEAARVSPHAPSNYKYELYGHLDTPKDHIYMRLSQFSRKTRMWTSSTNSGYTGMPTKNMLFPLMLGLWTIASIGGGPVTEYFLLMAVVLYGFTVAYTALRGVYDAFVNKSGEREWIYQLTE